MTTDRHARGFTRARATALVVIGLLMVGLTYLSLRGEETPTVPAGAKPGALTLQPCTYPTEAGSMAADCGTLVVPENRRDSESDLIALPVIRVRATGPDPAEPIFRLNGGPGATNLKFPQASRLTDHHDVVLVGYRGVDGSRRLDCPEVTSALQGSADLGGSASLRAATKAFADCSKRLTDDGVDLTSYSIPQRVDDLEAARVALGYQRINLISSSAGTRTAMIYSWRHPKALHRSAMISVNPPGHFLWDPKITDRQFARYARLCRQDARCAARTNDLAATMRTVAADVPDRWGPLPIKKGNVRIAGMYGMFLNGASSAPLNAPTIIDAYLAAADGDPSGLWTASVLGDLTIPSSFVWGEFASFGMIDAKAAERYYGAGGDPGSILGNTAADLLWGGPQGFFTVWPSGPDDDEYATVRPSDVETLLIGGTVDFSTPAELATRELLPTLSKGHQVTLAELGHTNDFWAHQPEAGKHLLIEFFDRGAVDASRFDTRPVDFEVGVPTMSTIGKILLGILGGGALIALVLLGGLVRRVRRRGGLGPRAGVLVRVLAPLPLGLGGWFLAVLIMWIGWPRMFIGSPLLAVPPMGLAIGLGTYLAWTRSDRSPQVRRQGLVAALLGSLLGAWFGFGAVDGVVSALTSVVGSTVTANLALLALDIRRGRRAARQADTRYVVRWVDARSD